MNESQFEQFLSHAAAAMQAKNDLLWQQRGIGDFARWDHDGRREQLTFSNPGDADTLLADTTSIGSYSLKTKTWLWAWANQSLTDAERAKAVKLKTLFDTTGMRVFADPHVDCDEYLAWELAAASVEHLQGIGCYRGPVGHLWVFWSIDAIATGRRAPKE
jgi:hypothetical protein